MAGIYASCALIASRLVRPSMSKIFASSGLVLAVALPACSNGDETGDAAGGQQTASPQPTSAATDGSGGGSNVIGGEETGLTLEIPDEWVDVPMDADTMSEGLDSLDLPEDEAGMIESSIGALGDLDGAIMAIDPATLGASVATNVNAYCVPNDGSVGENNLEAAVELGLGSVAGDVEVEGTTVDGVQAARATYTLDMAQVQGVGMQYMFLNGDDICWVTFTGADESVSGLFEEIAATIDVL